MVFRDCKATLNRAQCFPSEAKTDFLENLQPSVPNLAAFIFGYSSIITNIAYNYVSVTASFTPTHARAHTNTIAIRHNSVNAGAQSV